MANKQIENEGKHDFNPVKDDEESVDPAVVPPEGHGIGVTDDEATPVDETEVQPFQADLDYNAHIDTQHSDGSTHNPTQAVEQGLVYNAPTDPPVQPSDDLESGAVAAGFTPSMEDAELGVRKVPDAVDGADWDIVNKIQEALKLNSETRHLADRVEVEVENGVVTVKGSVKTQDDIGRAERVIADIPGVRNVYSEVELADESLA